MTALFKNLYRQYLEKGIPASDIEPFKEEMNRIPDEELWNTMIDMEKNSGTEIPMPLLIKRQIRKELHQIIWRQRLRQYMKYAALLAVILSTTFGAYSWLSDSKDNQMVAVVVKPGSKADIMLPDGTHVQLNAATNLQYDVNNAKQRLVKLSGEAFFEVAKNPECPFRVMINDLQIEVVGTSFNIKTYNKNTVEASLITGQIKISGGSLPGEYLLVPGEKATYSATNRTLKITQADTHVEAGWRDNYLIFDSKPLTEVIAQIERWYGVKIELRRSEIENDLLSGSFRDENIENIIQSLSIQYNFKYKIQKEIITIY